MKRLLVIKELLRYNCRSRQSNVVITANHVCVIIVNYNVMKHTGVLWDHYSEADQVVRWRRARLIGSVCWTSTSSGGSLITVWTPPPSPAVQQTSNDQQPPLRMDGPEWQPAAAPWQRLFPEVRGDDANIQSDVFFVKNKRNMKIKKYLIFRCIFLFNMFDLIPSWIHFSVLCHVMFEHQYLI